jgi:4-carboxymuconolactone decarboxylase
MKVLFRFSLICLSFFLIFSGNALSQQSIIKDTLLSVSPPVVAPAWPADIDPQSGFRLPLPRREDLGEAGKKTYDRSATNIAGLQGPAGIQLYSAKTSECLQALTDYLRKGAGFTPRIREIALITTSREMDNQFAWVAHESEALKAGAPQNVIDVIKHKKSTEGLDPTDAIVIEIGRQIWRDHKVSSQTFAKAKAIFGPNQLVDLVLLMGTHATTAALLTTFDVQLHKGSKPLLPIP